MSAPAPAGPRTIKEHNLALVLGAIAKADAGTGYPSRAQLAVATGLTRATVGGLVDQLMADGLLRELAPTRGARGRPGSPVQLNPDGAYGIGVEINVDYVSACAIDLTGAVRAMTFEPADNRTSAMGPTLSRAAAVAETVRAALGADARRIAGVTVALPGLVDGTGWLRKAPNLSRWPEFDVVTRAAAVLDPSGRLVVRADNEANLAALAQLWFGAERPLTDFIHVSGEIGIGAGIVMGGQLFRGPNGFAGELGHVVVEPNGPLCHCGGRGCLEQVAGQEALLRKADLDPAVESIDSLVAQLHRQSPVAVAAVSDAGRAIGRALAGAANLLGVTTVVLGGAYARLGAALAGPIHAELGRQVVSRDWSQPRVVLSDLGVDAAVRGAAGTVVRDVIAHPLVIVHD